MNSPPLAALWFLRLTLPAAGGNPCALKTCNAPGSPGDDRSFPLGGCLINGRRQRCRARIETDPEKYLAEPH